VTGHRTWIAAALLGSAATPLHALTPEELYAKVSPSIWFVYGMDGSERRISQGSGVVVGHQRVITNCHVIRNANTVFIRKENVLYIAKVEYRDTPRDLCQLQVNNFTAPAVEVGTSRDVKVGQKVFALGNPQGLEVSLSDGLVSALRSPDGKDPMIQTTAPISSGSSGGGLFDERGRLVGITTLQHRTGQNLNFAVPGEWIGELGERMKAAEEKKTSQIAAIKSAVGAAYNPAAPTLPIPGATWKYRYRDLKYSATQVFTVQVTGVDGWVVQETFTLDGAGSSQVLRSSIGAEEMRFFTRALPGSRTLVEFAPYLPAIGETLRPSFAVRMPSGYPKDRNNSEFDIRATLARNVMVKTAGAEHNAIKVVLRGTRGVTPTFMSGEIGRFEVTAWYSAETRRIVKLEHQAWYGNSAPAVDEVVELVEYSGG
jgi:serine protease Do